MFGLIGISYQTASQDERAQFSLSDTEAMMLIDDWISMGYMRGAIILSTCNRVEIYCETVSDCPKTLRHILDSWLVNLELRDKMRSRVTLSTGGEVLHHLFRLTSGMESMVVGETQVLGQVKDAFRLSVGHGQSTPLLSRMFHKAFEVAKRVRSRYLTTSIPLSAASSAVDMICRIEPESIAHRILIIGAGQMAEATLSHLGYYPQANDIAIYNRTRERAERLQQAHPHLAIYAEQELQRAVDEASVIFVTTSASSPILTENHFARRNSPVVIFDMAVPRNVSPLLADYPDVRLFTIDDLSDEEHSVEQEALLAEAESIVLEAQSEFESWVNASEVRQIIGRVHEASERILEREKEFLSSELPQEERESLERHLEHLRTSYTTAIVSSLRELAESGSIKHLDAVGKLFNHINDKLKQ